jgi:hypothetical protein
VEKQQQGSLGEAIDALKEKLEPVSERIIEITKGPPTPEATDAVQALMLQRMEIILEAAKNGSQCGHSVCHTVFVGECAKMISTYSETLLVAMIATTLSKIIAAEGKTEIETPCVVH